MSVVLWWRKHWQNKNGLIVGRKQFLPLSHSVYFIYTPWAFLTHFKYNVLKWKLGIHCVTFILEMAELGWDIDTKDLCLFCSQLQLLLEQIKTLSQLKDICKKSDSD